MTISRSFQSQILRSDELLIYAKHSFQCTMGEIYTYLHQDFRLQLVIESCHSRKLQKNATADFNLKLSLPLMGVPITSFVDTFNNRSL